MISNSAIEYQVLAITQTPKLAQINNAINLVVVRPTIQI